MKYDHISKEHAYYLGITMWGYLYQFPDLEFKWQLPKKLYALIKKLYFKCPCCAAYYNKKEYEKSSSCPGCPIDQNCIEGDKLYKKWSEATSPAARKKYAKKILDAIVERKY